MVLFIPISKAETVKDLLCLWDGLGVFVPLINKKVPNYILA